MSIKVLLFGHHQNAAKLLTILKQEQIALNDFEDIRVDTVKITSKKFLIFIIKQIDLVGSQAAGTNGLFYFLNSQKGINESKNQILQLLNQSKQLQGIPLVIGIQSQKNSNVKQIIGELQLFKLRDRATMVKQIDFNNIDSINEGFQWIQHQNKMRSYSFDAQPRVVNTKSKYRQQKSPSSKTYQSLMIDKKIRVLRSVQQEQKYLDIEKQRLKDQNMKNQLLNFSKNKKKMTPYDIKVSPNPKIEPNLNFFLKDSQNQKPNQANIKIQTDQFKVKLAQQSFTPKKTGIDTSTQVQDNQLFIFQRQVEPILNILVTKTLEFASLQIQQQEQILKMSKYKSYYNEKMKKQKDHEMQNLKNEQKKIIQKNKIIKTYQQKQKNKISCFEKVQAYKIAANITNNLYKYTTQNLYLDGYFPNNFQNQLQTTYVDFLINGTKDALQKKKQKNHLLNGYFDNKVVNKLTEQFKGLKQEHLNIKKKVENRRINYSQKQRVIIVKYNHDKSYISNFNRYLSKYLDKTLNQYHKNFEDKIKAIQKKIQNQEATQQSLQKMKLQQLGELTKHKIGFSIDFNRIAFTIAYNEFQKVYGDKKYLEIQILVYDKYGEFIQQYNSKQRKQSNYINYTQNLRDNNKIINMDQGYIIDLKSIPEKVGSLMLNVKIKNVGFLNKSQNKKLLKYASYGIQVYENNIEILKQKLSDLKIQQLIKADNEETQTSISDSIVFAYSLTRKKQFGGWYVEKLKKQTKAMKIEQQQNFKTQLNTFYKNCVNTDKQQRQQQQQEEINARKKQQQTIKDRKRKSTKNLKQELMKKKKLASKCLYPIKIKLNIPYSQILKLLYDQVQKFQEFITNATHGWELKFKNNILQKIDQIKKFKKIGDIILIKKQQIIVPQEIKNEDIHAQNQQIQ